MHEIEEQLCKLDSDKCVVEVGLGLLPPPPPALRGPSDPPASPV